MGNSSHDISFNLHVFSDQPCHNILVYSCPASPGIFVGRNEAINELKKGVLLRKPKDSSRLFGVIIKSCGFPPTEAFIHCLQDTLLRSIIELVEYRRSRVNLPPDLSIIIRERWTGVMDACLLCGFSTTCQKAILVLLYLSLVRRNDLSKRWCVSLSCSATSCKQYSEWDRFNVLDHLFLFHLTAGYSLSARKTCKPVNHQVDR